MKKYLGVTLAGAFFHICKSGHAIHRNPSHGSGCSEGKLKMEDIDEEFFA